MTEDKKLNAAESLALIGRMIENTRNRMAGSAGLHLLTWGYVTVTTTLAVWGLASYFDNTHWNYLWFMLPVAGYLITRLLGSETTGSCSRTYVDQVIDIIWKVIGFAALLVGSLAVLLSLLPWTRVTADTSPFVLIFHELGDTLVANALNVVVLTAALSVYNSCVYCNSRMLFGLAQQGNAPKALLSCAAKRTFSLVTFTGG